MNAALMTFLAVSFSVFPALQNLSYAVFALCCLSFLFMSALYIHRAQTTKFVILTFVYYFLLLVFTLLNGTDLKNAAYAMMEAFLMLMLIDYYRNDLRMMLLSCNITLSAIVYANLLLMVLFPAWLLEGKHSGESFFLGGNYNQMGVRLLCAIVTSVLCVRFSRKWIVNTVALVAVSVVTLLLAGSMTAVTSIAIYALFCLIPSRRLKILGLVMLFIFYLLFQTLVVFSGEGIHNNELMVYIVRDVLNKDLTFTGRTSLWDAAGKMVAQSPIIGYGYVDTDWYIANMSSQAIGPHNFVYSVLLNGGAVLMVLFVALCVLAYSRVRHLLAGDTTAVLLVVGFVTMLFMMTMEVYPLFFVVYLLALIYYYPELSSRWLVPKTEEK